MAAEARATSTPIDLKAMWHRLHQEFPSLSRRGIDQAFATAQAEHQATLGDVDRFARAMRNVLALDGEGLSSEHQAAIAIYRSILCLDVADYAAFWDVIADENRAEVIDYINGAATKLAALSAAEQLARIVRAAPGRRS
jgi:hypothetical protein